MGRNFVRFSTCPYASVRTFLTYFHCSRGIYIDGHAGRTFLALMKVDSPLGVSRVWGSLHNYNSGVNGVNRARKSPRVRFARPPFPETIPSTLYIQRTIRAPSAYDFMHESPRMLIIQLISMKSLIVFAALEHRFVLLFSFRIFVSSEEF